MHTSNRTGMLAANTADRWGDRFRRQDKPSGHYRRLQVRAERQYEKDLLAYDLACELDTAGEGYISPADLHELREWMDEVERDADRALLEAFEEFVFGCADGPTCDYEGCPTGRANLARYEAEHLAEITARAEYAAHLRAERLEGFDTDAECGWGAAHRVDFTEFTGGFRITDRP